MRWRQPIDIRAVTGAQNSGHLASPPAAEADAHHPTDDRPHHLMAERRGLYVECKDPASRAGASAGDLVSAGLSASAHPAGTRFTVKPVPTQPAAITLDRRPPGLTHDPDQRPPRRRAP